MAKVAFSMLVSDCMKRQSGQVRGAIPTPNMSQHDFLMAESMLQLMVSRGCCGVGHTVQPCC